MEQFWEAFTTQVRKEDSSFAAALTLSPAPRQGGSQKWPSWSATCPRNTTLQRKQNWDHDQVPFIHPRNMKNCLIEKSKLSLIFSVFLYLFFVNLCRNGYAQKYFQDCHEYWFAWVKPYFMRGATESGCFFAAVTNKRLLAHSQLSHPARDRNDGWCPWRILPRTLISFGHVLVSLHKKENKKDTGDRKHLIKQLVEVRDASLVSVPGTQYTDLTASFSNYALAYVLWLLHQCLYPMKPASSWVRK